jgi:hypothetical protein
MQILRPIFLALVVVGTCRGQVPTVSVLFPDVPSLAALKGVYPGISVGELLDLRKPVEAPYLGLREVVDGDTVQYHVDKPTSRQSAVEDAIFGLSRLNRGAVVHGINSWEPTATPEKAEREWTKRVVGLQRRTRSAVQCFTTKRAGVTRTALAHEGNVWMGVQLIEKNTRRSYGGDITFPAVVITFVSTKIDAYAPTQFARDTIACSQLARDQH